MANEQTSVPLFVADTILTAAQQNISAGTGVPVFATTVTRDAAFGGANKALAEGQLCYLSSTNVVQYYDGAAWATVGPAASIGLVRVGGGSVGTGNTVTYSNVFSSTYTSYLVLGSSLKASADSTSMTWILGGITSGYYTLRNYQQFNGGSLTSGLVSNNAANSGSIGDQFATQGAMWELIVTSPNLALHKTWTGRTVGTTTGGYYMSVAGLITSTTQATGITFTLQGAATFAGGNFQIFGYNEA